MQKVFVTFLIFFLCAMPVFASEITAIRAQITQSDILVSAQFNLSAKHIQDIKDGLSKEYVVYFDLFRVWELWPDEFIIGKRFVVNLKPNPITGELIASRFDGSVIREKRFKDISSMLNWALWFDNIKLCHINTLASGQYYIRISIESYLRKLPPVLSYMLFFVPEKEMSYYTFTEVFSIKPSVTK